MVVVIVGLLSTQTWNPSWNPFKQGPAGLVEESLGNLFNLKSFKLDGSLQADIQITSEDKTQEVNVAIDLVDAIDASEPDNWRTSGVLNARLGFEGMQLSFSGDIRTFGEEIYLKIKTLPAFLPLGESIAEVKNQWIKIDTGKLRELAQSPAIPTVDDSQAKETLVSLRELIKGKKMFEVKKDLGEEQSEGETLHRYLVGLNKETVKKLIPEFLEMMQKNIPAERKQEYENGLKGFSEKFPQKFEEIWRNFKGISFDIWTASDSTLKKFRWAKELDLTSFKELKDKIKQGRVNLIFEAKFSEFDKKFDIEEPKESKPLEEILPQFLPFDMSQGVTSTPFLPEESGE